MIAEITIRASFDHVIDIGSTWFDGREEKKKKNRRGNRGRKQHRLEEMEGPRLITLAIVHRDRQEAFSCFFYLCSLFELFVLFSFFSLFFLLVTVLSMDGTNFIDSRMSHVVAFIVEVERCVDSCNKKQNECNETLSRKLLM